MVVMLSCFLTTFQRLINENNDGDDGGDGGHNKSTPQRMSPRKGEAKRSDTCSHKHHGDLITYEEYNRTYFTKKYLARNPNQTRCCKRCKKEFMSGGTPTSMQVKIGTNTVVRACNHAMRGDQDCDDAYCAVCFRKEQNL